MVYHSLLGSSQGDMGLGHGVRTQHRQGDTYVRKRSLGLAIFEKGTSVSRAHEHSTTAIPSLAMMSLSAGLITQVPLGLDEMRIAVSPTTRTATHDTTTPRKRCPTLSSLMRPSLASFFPEHLRGSQWSKSWFVSVVSTSSISRSTHSPTWLRGRRCCQWAHPHRIPAVSSILCPSAY